MPYFVWAQHLGPGDSPHVGGGILSKTLRNPSNSETAPYPPNDLTLSPCLPGGRRLSMRGASRHQACACWFLGGFRSSGAGERKHAKG